MAISTPTGAAAPITREHHIIPLEQQSISKIAFHVYDLADQLISRLEAFRALEQLCSGKHDGHVDMNCLAQLVHSVTDAAMEEADYLKQACQTLRGRLEGVAGS